MFAVALGSDAEFRPLEPWQAGEFAAHVELARAFLEPWLPWAREVVDEDSARGFLQPYAARQSRDEGRIYGIWLGGRLVGGALFRVFDAEAGMAEIGAWLDPGATGRGLVTDAVRHMIEWAFEERGLHRIEWHCAPANAPSIAVAKRLGMTREGILRQAFNNNGRLEDLEIWALLASDRTGGPAAARSPRQIAARYFEMWNTGDSSIADEILCPDWVDHAHPEVAGPDDVRQAVEKTRLAQPDMRFRIDAILGDGGDLVAVVGAAARGQDDPAAIRLVWLIRLKDGQMAEMWTYRGAAN